MVLWSGSTAEASDTSDVTPNTGCNLESPCNSVLITKLLDIISDAVKMCSRVRVATLNLALFLLVLVTRDASQRCQLTENQIQQLQTAFFKCRNILRDLYLRNHIALQRFRFLLRPSLISATSLDPSYRAQKLDPSKLLENTAFLFSHAEDAFKLFSNHSEENLPSSLSSSNSASTSIYASQAAQTSSQDIPPYTALPFSQLESIQHIIAVYHCLKGYLCSYIFLNGELKSISVSNIESLNEVTAPGGSEKRYLIISDVQMILVEPGPHKLSSTLTDKLLSVPERLRSSTQTPMSKDASRLRFPLMPAANKPTLKTVGSVPAILLRKAATAHIPTAPHQRPNETNISSQSSS
ncbi:hypothetical protein Aperf_G00000003711 [Anoplocephala perfoliata]